MPEISPSRRLSAARGIARPAAMKSTSVALMKNWKPCAWNRRIVHRARRAAHGLPWRCPRRRCAHTASSNGSSWRPRRPSENERSLVPMNSTFNARRGGDFLDVGHARRCPPPPRRPGRFRRRNRNTARRRASGNWAKSAPEPRNPAGGYRQEATAWRASSGVRVKGKITPSTPHVQQAFGGPEFIDGRPGDRHGGQTAGGQHHVAHGLEAQRAVFHLEPDEVEPEAGQLGGDLDIVHADDHAHDGFAFGQTGFQWILRFATLALVQ